MHQKDNFISRQDDLSMINQPFSNYISFIHFQLKYNWIFAHFFASFKNPLWRREVVSNGNEDGESLKAAAAAALCRGRQRTTLMLCSSSSRRHFNVGC